MKVAVITETAIIQRLAEGVQGVEGVLGASRGGAGASRIAVAEVKTSSRGAG